MNIVLIGMRGSGKTTVGKLLSEKLEKPFIEMDELVVQKANLDIPQIVEKYGWEHFRNLESQVVEEIAKKDNAVISCGGGVVVKPQNMGLLSQNGKIFWLKVTVETLLKRIGDDPNRPSLTGRKSRKEDMEETLKERLRLYEEAANEKINTETNNVNEVADIIISKL